MSALYTRTNRLYSTLLYACIAAAAAHVSECSRSHESVCRRAPTGSHRLASSSGSAYDRAAASQRDPARFHYHASWVGVNGGLHAHFPRPDGLLLGDKVEEEEDKVAALEMEAIVPAKEIPGYAPGYPGGDATTIPKPP